MSTPAITTFSDRRSRQDPAAVARCSNCGLVAFGQRRPVPPGRRCPRCLTGRLNAIEPLPTFGPPSV